MEWGLNEYMEPVESDSARPDRELVPEGRHSFQIDRANENGPIVTVVLAHADNRYRWVWCRMLQDREIGRRIASSLRVALGISAEEWKRAAIDDLVGRHVEAEIYHQVKNDTTWANVRRFHAAEPPAAPQPAKPAARRTPLQKADAASSTVKDDDIPF
jgi:hypothetical protein